MSKCFSILQMLSLLILCWLAVLVATLAMMSKISRALSSTRDTEKNIEVVSTIIIGVCSSCDGV